MKSITINGSQRESVGKKAAKALRNAGQVPCVLYGGDKPVHFAAAELAFSKLVYTPNAHTVVINLEGGETFSAVLQDIQFHPVTDRILHVDFYQLFEDKEIALDIPVNLVGNSKGVKNGGILRRNNRKLRVKALPANLPDFIEVDITPLKIGDKVAVSELANEKYTFLHTDNTVVCQIKTSRTAVVEDDEEEEGAEAPAAEAAQE
ncbi:50S ribosomal protein L25/general stress protein Ctc [Algibacter lectus]|uniref:Large ribosomal subunit protein bL25 n=1 Tax=Algibacter lectus TaxID=221126 RepID=A0A090VZJ1_9FLAO|nr:50S ribosomal protein L25/general stress protein Ctc [Algibacter lectus]MWW24258.1 50S ribosomal protein L25/general stress protein Ctc [Algibacter lectus]TDY62277.1 large subunit ribosomal protein L25 [Algibacter lectus]SFC70700.1 large subunit ribosomal protein L25 [Algibacter lectus]GAL60697.1 LSU ribosomal protein L25p [Algibacter lectus]GAL78467.1 LSU ribosomal protein L25p [Algibacter lectus]